MIETLQLHIYILVGWGNGGAKDNRIQGVKLDLLGISLTMIWTGYIVKILKERKIHGQHGVLLQLNCTTVGIYIMQNTMVH